jgi:NADPH:quinone reductase-like Zn-dependent oxidoreductase
VTATASARNLAFVARLGAHNVLDYTGRFADQIHDVDVVIDPVGGDTAARSWPVMRSGATLVAIAEEPLKGESGRNDVRAVYFVVKPDGGQLRELAAPIDKRQLHPMVSSSGWPPSAPPAFPAKSSSASDGTTGRQAMQRPASLP